MRTTWYRRLAAGAGLAGILALSGCAIHPHDQRHLGTGVGAVAGGVVGNALFGTPAGTIGGAVAGAVIGSELSQRHNHAPAYYGPARPGPGPRHHHRR